MGNDLQNNEFAYFAGGCFWCTEAVFQNLRGVISVTSGYSGGSAAEADYYAVASGRTSHAECVKINFDSSIITYKDLLSVFFATHDPTTLNRQGNDIGPQYRSVIFYDTDYQKKLAEQFVSDLNKEKIFDSVIITKIEKLNQFYPAESEHQNFYNNNVQSGYCQVVINPKLVKLKSKFSSLLEN